MTVGKRIFLAHAREDKPQVRKFYADLKARGLEPWLDEIDLLPGQNWKDEIAKAIRMAAVFLACLSSRSVDKVGYVQNEFRLALSAFGERPPGSIYFIPVRFDDCNVPDLQIPDRGLSLRDIQWVDLWQEGGLERLVASIKEALTIGTPPPQAVRKEAPSTSWPPQPIALQSKVLPDKPAVLIAPNDRSSFLSQPVDRDTLADYTKWKYRNLPLNQKIHELLIRDLVHSRFSTLWDVDLAIETATEAVQAYRRENPGLFQAGTDFITKSLGFVDLDFRATHPFSQRTREAFSKYEHLLRPNYERGAAQRQDLIDRSREAVTAEPATGREPEPSRWSLRHPAIVAAIIAAIGAVAAALVSSPLLVNWLSDQSDLPLPVPAKEVVTAREIVEANRDAVVFLHVTGTDTRGAPQETFATGFLVSSTGHVITAKHVLFDDQGRALPDEYDIIGAVGSRYEQPREMEVRARDPDSDVLLLQFRGNRKDYKTVDVCTGLSIAVGADLVTIGFPHGSDLSVLTGVLSNQSGTGGLWQTNLAVTPGYAGAPVFATDGRVVGSVRGERDGAGVLTPIDDASYVLNRLPEAVQQCE